MVPLQKLLVGSLAFLDALRDGASLAFKTKETTAQFIISVCDSFEISSLTLTNSPTVAWIPGEGISVYNVAVRQRHAAILGICALVDSYPYTVERWMPELLTSVLAEHTYDPVSRLSDVSADEFADAHGPLQFI